MTAEVDRRTSRHLTSLVGALSQRSRAERDLAAARDAVSDLRERFMDDGGSEPEWTRLRVEAERHAVRRAPHGKHS